MTFSLRLNNDQSFAELAAIAAAAEDAGFDQLWVSNDLFLRAAPVLVGALIPTTERLQLGIAVMNPYSVHVSELAMVAATAQEASGGRFLLGVGAGSEQFLGWAGIDRPHPLGTTASAVGALRALLGHRDVDPAGAAAVVRRRGRAALPGPVARPGVRRRDGSEDVADGR